MEDITIKITLPQVKAALEQAADNLFKSSYSNPIADLLKKCIEEKESDVKKIVNEIITNSINSPEFKLKMADIIIQKMVEGALKNK